MQESLLSEWSAPTWPRSAIGGPTTACELPTWARLTDETAGSVSPPSHLLPTPSAQESTPTDDFLGELREGLDPDDPHHRLWLAHDAVKGKTPEQIAEHREKTGGGAFNLNEVIENAPTLLPMPRTNDGTGTFPHDRPEDMDNLATRISRLLPTPAASDAGGRKAGWEGRQGGLDLGAAVEDEIALLPTPSAWLGRRPENATADPERMASREHEGVRGKRSLELPEALALAGVTEKLLPTAGDAKSSGSRNLEGSNAHPGVSLTDAIQTGDSTTPRLLPTPQAADGDGGRQEKGAMSVGGKRPSGQKATLPLPTAVSMREDISETPFAAATELEQASLFDLADIDGDGALLPTPVANPENPGAGGELRAALVHGEGRRNETGVDTLGRPNRGRAGADPELLPTPNTRDHHAQGAGHNPKAHSTALSTVVEKTDQLLPTPTTQDAENTAGPSQHKRNSDPLNVTAAKLLPTPTAADGEHASEQGPRFYAGGGDNPTLLGAARRSEIAWGVYEGAVRRWEAVLGRDAPPPTDEKGRLAPEFVEWMLGYPDGWFDLPDLKRTAKLRALGNSVQVQCGEVVGEWTRALVLSGILLEDA